jgi:hypothetical protein
MSRGEYSLERLFGVDRHKLPTSLPPVRRGRRVFYDLRHVLECIEEFLESGQWLADVQRRKLVLSGIIDRAKQIGQHKVATLLNEFFQRYLT